MKSWSFVVGGALLLGVGCGEGLDIPIPLESPPQEINATQAVEDFEEGLCDNPASEECVILQAIDYSDDQQVGNPARIPPEFPVVVPLVDPDTGIAIPDPDTGEPQEIDVLAWLDETGASDNIDVKQAIPVDLTEQAAQSGITPDKIENVSIGNFALNWIENSLTFSTVDLDLYASTSPVDENLDADQLIADGLVSKIGVIPAQAPETTGEAPISFAEGGNAVLNQALRNLVFTLVIAVPPGTELELADGAAAGTKKKPTGEGLVSVKATLVYTVKVDGGGLF